MTSSAQIDSNYTSSDYPRQASTLLSQLQNLWHNFFLNHGIHGNALRAARKEVAERQPSDFPTEVVSPVFHDAVNQRRLSAQRAIFVSRFPCRRRRFRVFRGNIFHRILRRAELSSIESNKRNHQEGKVRQRRGGGVGRQGETAAGWRRLCGGRGDP